MKQGMLWYDSRTASDFHNRLSLAVDYFTQKYGFPPACCFVHPDTLKGAARPHDAIKVVADQKVLRNHIWMEFPQTQKSPV